MNKMSVLENNKDKIIELSKSGISNKELGKKYNCSNRLIASFLKKYNIKSICTGSYKIVDLSQYENQIINQYKDGKSAYSISKELNLKIASVNKLLKLKGFNISDGHRKYKGDTELKTLASEIVRIYLEEKIGVDTIAKRFGTTGSSIRKIINDAGVMRDYKYYQYDIDENYFSCINTRNKAYILGFMYADGNVTNRGWKLKLQKRDKCILDNIKDEIKYTGPLLWIKPDKIKKSQGAFCLSVAKVAMVSDFINLSCMPNKTWQIRFPTNDQVPSEFIPDFIRGYCDGDGSIAKQSRTIYFIGNKFFILGLINNLPLSETPRLYYQQSVEFPDDPDKQLISAHIGVKHGCLDVFNYLYGNCQDTLYLKRKYELAQRWLSQ